MNDELKRLFEEELELVKEESPVMPLAEQVEIAKDRLIERVTGYIVRIAGNRVAAHQEAVNLAFFN